MNFKERYIYNPTTDLLGKGGFARVYKAQDKLLNRTVALKFFIRDVNEKHTLIKEISKAVQLEHSNLCRYFDAAVVESNNVHGEKETIEVGVMEYLEAGNIQSYLKLYPQHIDKLLEDVLRGISFLHDNSIIHRDLKAQNILVTQTAKGPVAKITDFGISKVAGSETTSSSALLGTIEYMAPEQFHPEKYGINGKISTNLDFWGFGLLLYEIYTGEKYFSNNNKEEMNTARVMGSILADDDFSKLNKLPEPYRSIAKSCLVKNANERVQNAAELIGMLKKGPGNIYEAETRVIAAPPSPAKEFVSGTNNDTSSNGDGKRKPVNVLSGNRKKRIIAGAVILISAIVLALVLNSSNSKNDKPLSVETPTEDTINSTVAIDNTANSNSEIDDILNVPLSVPGQQDDGEKQSNKEKVKKESNSSNQVTCSNCNGEGVVTVSEECSACKGKKYELCRSCYSYAGSGKCVACAGSKFCQEDGNFDIGNGYFGNPGTGKCRVCAGKGEIYYKNSITDKWNFYKGEKCSACNRTGKCITCNGTGKCKICNGEGTCQLCKGSGLSSNSCKDCNGTGKGKETTETCPVCKGKKYI